MGDTPKQEIKLFYCYAHEDKPLRDEMEKHLSWLKRRYQWTNWHDREILPGEEWEQAIDTHLNSAHLILLLISSDFMASDYCYGKEMQHALERHNAGTCRVVPILLRPTYWEDAPFSSLQLLPANAKPITLWPNRDEAFQDVVTEVSRTIKDLLISLKTKGEQPEVRLDPNDASNYCSQTFTSRNLRRYKNALIDDDLDINLFESDYSSSQVIRLRAFGHYKEALTVIDGAISYNPNNADSYRSKADILSDLKRYDEALTAIDQAISLNDVYDYHIKAYNYHSKANILSNLKRYDEAEQALEKAHQLE